MTNRKTVLIANPKTGRYESRRARIGELSDYLKSIGVDVELRLTTRPGDATEIAFRAAHNGTADVIVAGGDGTINEAVQGMAGTSARLAIIPRGTANVLARELELPLEPQEAADLLVRGHSRKVHLGVAINETTNDKRYFLLMAGIGLDASVVLRVQPALKKRVGKLAFWLSGLSHLASWNPVPFSLEIEGKQYNATFAAIGKAARYGGDLSITPRARLDQPDFEICVFETSSRRRYLRLLSEAMRNGLTENSEGVRFLRAKSVRAIGDVPVQVDGEVIGNLPMRFEIAEHSLEVIVP
jgi:diacylglycerol kinase (ATP)